MCLRTEITSEAAVILHFLIAAYIGGEGGGKEEERIIT